MIGVLLRGQDVASLDMEQTFGKYRLLRHIGRGGMGVVYLAEDQTLGRHVALKILDRSMTSGEDFEHRFRQEARTVASLNHPNIVTIHSLEKVDEDLAIDMPYVEGGSLAEAEEKGAATLHEIVHYVRDILLALACCHEAGIIHRDVKPSNILLTLDGRALLSDFGLAKLLVAYQTTSLSERTSSGFFLGTPRYSPPESWDGAEPAPSWDVYSVGMVLFEAAAGRVPYDAQTPLALMKQMIERPIPPLLEVSPGISPELSALVGTMLARDPGERLPDAGEVLEEYAKLPEMRADTMRASTIIQLLPSKAPTRRSKSVRKRVVFPWRGLGVGLGIALLVVVVCLGVYAAFYARSLGGSDIEIPENSAGFLFDSIEASTQQINRGYWYVLPASEPNTWYGLGHEGAQLSFLKIAPSDQGSVTLEGFWGEYADETARVFRYGTLAGTGRWIEPARELGLSVSFRCTQDGEQWNEPVTLKRSARVESQRQYVRRLEKSPCFLPILYSELLPRSGRWVDEVERLFILPVASGLHARFLKGEDIKIDGGLDDAGWEDAFSLSAAFGESAYDRGAIQLETQGGKAVLAGRYSNLGLFLGIRVPGQAMKPRIALSLSERCSVPMTEAERYFVHFEENRASVCRRLAHGQEVPWECSWKVADSAEEGGWKAEVLVPYDAAAGLSRPEPSDRWRMNCTVSGLSVSGSDTTLTWGYEDVAEVEHGFVIVFGSQAEKTAGR